MTKPNMQKHPNRVRNHAVLANCPHCGQQDNVVIKNRFGSAPMVVCNNKKCNAITSFMELDGLTTPEQLTETIKRYNQRAGETA